MVVRRLLQPPDDKLDLAVAKLTIDRVIDPSVDVDAIISQLDTMVARIRAMVPVNANSRTKFESLRKYVYEAGPWNGGRPFDYDLADPLGQSIRGKLLPVYLATKR